MNRDSRIYVAGHRGLAGSALMRGLQGRGYHNLITRTHAELDLEQQTRVDRFFAQERPQYVLLAAARVGGIHANYTYPVDFLLRNLKIEINVIEAAWRYGVDGLLFLGSSCIYPRLAPQPLKEEYILSGPLEATNEAYAVAKIAGIKLCEAYNRQYGTRFLSVMPTNLYGPNDNYDLETSHVLPALIRKFHLAKLARAGDWDAVRRDEAVHGSLPSGFFSAGADPEQTAQQRVQSFPHHFSNKECHPIVKLWGSGSPRREFLFADDLADACIFLMNRLDELFGTDREWSKIRNTTDSTQQSPAPAHHLINIGCGEELTIRELAEMVAGIVGYDGPVEWDAEKPDGTPRKLLDVSRITSLGWRPKTTLEDGIRVAYRDYLLKGKS